LVNGKRAGRRFGAAGQALCLLLALVMTFTLAGCFGFEGLPEEPAGYQTEQSSFGSLELIEDSDEEPEPAEQPSEEAPDESGGAEEISLPEETSDTQEPPETSASEAESEPEFESESDSGPVLDEHGSYTTKEDVALYIHTYGRLPDNFITKNEARELGWSGGSLEPYAKGCCIGGDYFGNREGKLPKAAGRKYTECDIDTLGARSRGSKRIVFSNDGLIYYTEDHYETFELLYGEE